MAVWRAPNWMRGMRRPDATTWPMSEQNPRAVSRRLEVGGKMVPRDPIHQKFGPSVPRVFVSRKVERAMHVVARTRWVIEMQQQLRFFLSRFGGR